MQPDTSALQRVQAGNTQQMMDEARRVASNIAKPTRLLGKGVLELRY